MLCAACGGPARWEKPGATQAAIEQDTQDCRMQARLAPEAHPVPLSSPTGLGTPPAERIEDREAREAQQFQICMRAKGYSARR